jgi:hypothetical protein
MIQEQTGDDITIGFQAVEKLGWENKLSDFRIVNVHIDKGRWELLYSKSSLIQKIIGGMYFLSFRKYKRDSNTQHLKDLQVSWQPRLNKYGIYWINTGEFEPTISKKAGNIIIKGQFDNPDFFDGFSDKIRREFVPKQSIIEKNEAMYTNILNSNSIAFCVRRGDYLLNIRNKYIFEVCDLDYYVEAIRVIKERISNPIFFVFSDDLAWVKNTIKFGCPVCYENSDNPSWETLRLMYSCKHFVISNSTCHWWGQYLSLSKEKMVICPEYWFNPLYSKERCLLEDRWIKIPVDQNKFKVNAERYYKSLQ